jgi:hypothetical protein
MKAGLAEAEFMLAVAHVDLFLCFFHLIIADFAGGDVFEVPKLASKHTPQLRFLDVLFGWVLGAALDASELPQSALHESGHSGAAGEDHRSAIFRLTYRFLYHRVATVDVDVTPVNLKAISPFYLHEI